MIRVPPRRRVPVAEGRAALASWRRGSTDAAIVATAVRYTVEELGDRVPGRAVELRVPPYAAVQCVAGPTHRRGTPANVVETDPATWLALAAGTMSWNEAWQAGRLSVSGTRANLAAYLPLEAAGRDVP